MWILGRFLRVMGKCHTISKNIQYPARIRRSRDSILDDPYPPSEVVVTGGRYASGVYGFSRNGGWRDTYIYETCMCSDPFVFTTGSTKDHQYLTPHYLNMCKKCPYYVKENG